MSKNNSISIFGQNTILDYFAGTTLSQINVAQLNTDSVTANSVQNIRTLDVQDPIISMASGNAGGINVGLACRINGNSFCGILRDSASEKFVFVRNGQTYTPSTNLSGCTLMGIVLNDITGASATFIDGVAGSLLVGQSLQLSAVTASANPTSALVLNTGTNFVERFGATTASRANTFAIRDASGIISSAGVSTGGITGTGATLSGNLFVGATVYSVNVDATTFLKGLTVVASGVSTSGLSATGVTVSTNVSLGATVFSANIDATTLLKGLTVVASGVSTSGLTAAGITASGNIRSGATVFTVNVDATTLLKGLTVVASGVSTSGLTAAGITASGNIRSGATVFTVNVDATTLLKGLTVVASGVSTSGLSATGITASGNASVGATVYAANIDTTQIIKGNTLTLAAGLDCPNGTVTSQNLITTNACFIGPNQTQNFVYINTKSFTAVASGTNACTWTITCNKNNLLNYATALVQIRCTASQQLVGSVYALYNYQLRIENGAPLSVQVDAKTSATPLLVQLVSSGGSGTATVGYTISIQGDISGGAVTGICYIEILCAPGFTSTNTWSVT